jgi:hypothetical protein
MGRILRMRKSIAAHCAVNVGAIRRMTDHLAPGMGVNGCFVGCGNGRGFSSRFDWSWKADEVEQPFRSPIRAKKPSACPQPKALPAGFSIRFARVRNNPHRFDSAVSIVVWRGVPSHHHTQGLGRSPGPFTWFFVSVRSARPVQPVANS